MRIETIEDVVDYQLCTGCGACAAAEPDCFEMVNDVRHGLRPTKRPCAIEATGKGFSVCPGHKLTRESPGEGVETSMFEGWGPVLNVWEAHASDASIRLAASSGGAATALALYCIEQLGMSGALHIGANRLDPLQNESKYSTSKAELLENVGSRYAPAAPCTDIYSLLEKNFSSVFIGKPCDIAAANSLAKHDPSLSKRIGATISFFCAGTPSTQGSIDLISEQGIDPDQLVELDYRGQGWPGNWMAKGNDQHGREKIASLSYQESWGFIERFRQWRCYICPDHTGEFSDISVGDPWYRDILEGESGSSLIVARTQRGNEIVENAVKSGYLVVQSTNLSLLARSQPGLLSTKGSLWGRLLSLRLSGAAVPSYSGFSFFRFWISELTIREKLASIVVTLRRVARKGLRARVPSLDRE